MVWSGTHGRDTQIVRFVTRAFFKLTPVNAAYFSAALGKQAVEERRRVAYGRC
jgi:hypothetical protein